MDGCDTHQTHSHLFLVLTLSVWCEEGVLYPPCRATCVVPAHGRHYQRKGGQKKTEVWVFLSVLLFAFILAVGFPYKTSNLPSNLQFHLIADLRALTETAITSFPLSAYGWPTGMLASVINAPNMPTSLEIGPSLNSH